MTRSLHGRGALKLLCYDSLKRLDDKTDDSEKIYEMMFKRLKTMKYKNVKVVWD